MEQLITVAGLIKQMIIAMPSIIALTMALTSAFNGIVKITNPTAKKVVSWVIAVLAGAGFAVSGGLTMFAEPVANIIAGAVFGLVAGGAANGVYEWSAIENFFKLIEGLFNPTIKAQKEA